MGLIAVRMRARLARLRAGRFGWPALVACLLAGGMTAMAMERVVPRGPREPSERAHAPGRAAAHAAHKLEYALRWLKVWPERAPAPGRRAGPLTERDFPLAAGLAGRFAAQFPGSPIAVQLAIQEAAEGSDREQQVYDTRAFAALCAAPEESIAALGGALDSDEAGADAGQMTRLVLAIAHATGAHATGPHATGPQAGLAEVYRRTFTRPTHAGAPGAEAPLLALYGLLRLDEGDAAAQRAAVRDALAAQAGDPQLQAALRRVVVLRSEELFR